MATDDDDDPERVETRETLTKALRDRRDRAKKLAEELARELELAQNNLRTSIHVALTGYQKALKDAQAMERAMLTHVEALIDGAAKKYGIDDFESDCPQIDAVLIARDEGTGMGRAVEIIEMSGKEVDDTVDEIIETFDLEVLDDRLGDLEDALGELPDTVTLFLYED